MALDLDEKLLSERVILKERKIALIAQGRNVTRYCNDTHSHFPASHQPVAAPMVLADSGHTYLVL
jgi:hypothetical protein